MSETTTALVTGANKGIGYEIAAGLGALGLRVGVGARLGPVVSVPAKSPAPTPLERARE